MKGAMPDDGLDLPGWDDVLEAHGRIAPHIHRTPILTSSFINALTGAELFFKCENFLFSSVTCQVAVTSRQ